MIRSNSKGLLATLAIIGLTLGAALLAALTTILEPPEPATLGQRQADLQVQADQTLSQVNTALLDNRHFQFAQRTSNLASLRNTLKLAIATSNVDFITLVDHQGLLLIGTRGLSEDKTHYPPLVADIGARETRISNATLLGTPYRLRLDPTDAVSNGHWLISGISVTDAGAASSVSSSDEAVAASRAKILTQRFGVLAVLGLLAAWVFSRWSSRNLFQSTTGLTAGIQRIAHGDYRTPITESEKSELASLVVAMNAMQRDLAEREHLVVSEALRDPLTHLHSQRLGRERLQLQLDNAHRRHESVAVIRLDVGASIDEKSPLTGASLNPILLRIADRLRTRLRASDTVARASSNGFLIVANNVDTLAVRDLVVDLLRCLEAPVPVNGAECTLDLITGVAIYPQHGENADQLFTHANEALGTARAGGMPVHFYEAQSSLATSTPIALMADLKLAMAERNVELHYSPTVALHSQQLHCVDANLHWVHPAHGNLHSADVVAMAEASGNSLALSDWMLRSLIAQLGHWNSMGRMLTASMRLSTLDLKDDGLLSRLIAYTRTHRVEPSQLIVRIDQRLSAGHADKALHTLNTLRVAGVRLALDDLGSTPCSLTYLRDMPLSEIRVAGAAVTGDDADSTHSLFARALVDLGHSVGCDVIVTDIDQQSDWHTLMQLGYDFIQGSVVSRALPAPDVLVWVQQHEELLIKTESIQANW